MIIPTPEYDPLFANDGVPFRTKMLAYIDREFADLLGNRRGLPQSDQGLDALSRLVGPSPDCDVRKAA